MTDHLFQDLPWYRRYAIDHEPDETITANNEGQPYLLRWHLIPKNKFLNIYLHRFIGPDQRVMHDHPWISLAYHLEGRFQEIYWQPKSKFSPTCAAYALEADRQSNVRYINKGDWTYRSSRFLHYLTPGPKGTWTIFITGPTIRKWGFITNTGWRPWKEVVANAPSHERRDY